jgi:hypothetical protein
LYPPLLFTLLELTEPTGPVPDDQETFGPTIILSCASSHSRYNSHRLPQTNHAPSPSRNHSSTPFRDTSRCSLSFSHRKRAQRIHRRKYTFANGGVQPTNGHYRTLNEL